MRQEVSRATSTKCLFHAGEKWIKVNPIGFFASVILKLIKMKKYILLIALCLSTVATTSAQTKKTMETKSFPEGTIVRISIGYFQPEQTEKVESRLNNEFKNSLIPAIKKLKGNLGYYVGIDKEKHTMTNVSFWQTKDDAIQMPTLKEMLDMRTTFEALGLKFIEISNHEIVWKL
jgi:hypothetical protein